MFFKPFLIYLVAMVSTALYSTVQAEELPDDFQFRIGAYQVTNTDTRMNIGSSGGLIGTNIRYSRDLGGDDKESVPHVQGYYRFNDTHRFNYGWYKVERFGTVALQIDIDFGDETFTTGTTVNSFINAEILKLTYQYSFYRSDKVEMGVSAGLHIMDYSMGISETSGGANEVEDVTAPLPIFGFHLNYKINPRWHVLMDYDIFYIELESTTEGSISDFQLATEYRFFRTFAMGVGINSTALDVSVDDSDFNGTINDTYKGYEIYAALYF